MKEQIIEAILIIENLMAYGRIHTVSGVSYIEGSHEEFLEKAELWLIKNRNNNHDKTKDILIAMLESQLKVERIVEMMYKSCKKDVEQAISILKINELERQLNELKG